MDILLLVPGKWDDEKTITQIPDQEQARNYFYDENENQIVDLAVKPHDPHLVSDFKALISYEVPEEEYERLDQHTHNVFLVATIHTLEDTKNIMKATAEVVKSGGMAVKVESSKTISTSAEWLVLSKNTKNHNLFRAFVSFMKDDNYIYSYGMNILRMPDARITKGTDEYYDYNVLRNFLFKGFVEDIQYEDGQTITMYEEEPEYKISLISDDRGQDSLFYNEFGIWNLEKK